MLFVSRPSTVLIVEDDVDVRELVRTRLELAGFRTTWANDGRDALDQVARTRPDAVVLDINLPRLDGFGLLEHWRRHDVTPPPTLVLTARHGSRDVERAIALGARDYLAKPFEDRSLIARVCRLLRPSPPAFLEV